MYKVHQEELSQRVYQRIKEMILTNQLVSGQKLSQEALATDLGVSRTPLLSAFSKLEKEFLVRLVPRRGAFVRKLTRAELEDLYDIRMRLEPLGAHDAALRGTAEDLEALEAAHQSFVSLVRAEAEPAEAERRAGGPILEADYRFHMAIMRMSHNDFLYQMVSSFNLIIVSNLEGLLKPAAQSLEEHTGILEAIRGGDETRADALMYAHIADARRHLAGIGIG